MNNSGQIGKSSGDFPIQSFEDFMKNQLVKYIHQELLKGHSPIAIKETLIKGGHHHDIVEEVLNILHDCNYDLNEALKVPVKGRLLKQNMYYDVFNAVVKYIELMLEHGYNIHQIEDALYKFGHTRDIVDRAIDAVLFGKQEETDYVALAQKFILPVTIAIYLLFSLLVSSAARTGIDRVMLGFLGLLLTIVFVGFPIKSVPEDRRKALFLAPFVFGGVFYLLGGSLSYFETMDIPVLTAWNVLFGFLVTALFYATLSETKREKKRRTHLEEEPIPLLEELEKDIRKLEREKQEKKEEQAQMS